MVLQQKANYIFKNKGIERVVNENKIKYDEEILRNEEEREIGRRKQMTQKLQKH